MPCIGPPPPSDAEIQAQKMCRSIKFVMDHLGEEVPGWVTRAIRDPFCNEFDQATVELCRLCRLVPEDFIYNGRSREARTLADWYDDHKAHDIAIEEYRRRERQQQRLRDERARKRNALISSMSDADLKLLGVKRP